jgi:hypothetical protein
LIVYRSADDAAGITQQPRDPVFPRRIRWLRKGNIWVSYDRRSGVLPALRRALATLP